MRMDMEALMSKRLVAIGLGILVTVRVFAAPDLILFNGDVFTADARHPHAEAFAVEDGRFIAVGTDAAIRALAVPSTRLVDAGGRRVIPGIIDAHIHVDSPMPGRSIDLAGPPFPGPTADETLAAVAAAVKAGPGWLSGVTGYPVFNDSRDWRSALDAVAPTNPVLLVGCCGHAMMLNSRAMEALGIADDIQDPIGGRWGRTATGHLDGQVYESATIWVARRVAAMDPEASLSAARIRRVADVYMRWGVTSVNQMAHEAPLPEVRVALERAGVPIRWTVYAWGLPQFSIADAWREVDTDGGVWPALTRLGGSKWVLDASPLERGAFQLEDYADRPGWRGRSNYNAAQLKDILAGALASSHQVALHTVGDGEAEMLLRLMAELAPPDRWKKVRVRVEHGDGMFGDRLARAAALGIVIVQNPVHLDGLLVEGGQTMQDARWGARSKRFQPLKNILAAGVHLTFASDSVSADMVANPFLNIMIASTYPRNPTEAITREQALAAYTTGGAYAEQQEMVKGRIAVGLVGDWAVLSQDILHVPASALPATVSLLTAVAGKIIYAVGPFAAP
jgi:predicted amidohydrolase YtcJ